MSEDYGSHMPVLRAVCGLLQPRSILELGAGHHSTPFFLSQPIERLTTVETDPDWFESIQSGHPDDSRFHLHPDLLLLEQDSLAGFDLVFIDDGKNQAEREVSIRWVLEQKHPPTIVHDAEVYATVINELSPSHAVIPTRPETAVIW